MRNLELWKLEIGVAVRPDYNKMRGKVFQFLFRGYDACMGLQGVLVDPMLGGVAGVAGGARRPHVRRGCRGCRGCSSPPVRRGCRGRSSTPC